MRAAALVVVIVLAGCGESQPATPAAAPSPPASSQPGCDYRVKGKALHGDVDGDGSADRVTLRAARRCRHRLVVELAAGEDASATVRPLPWPGTDPRLLRLAQIDGRDGVEPVVSLSPANVYRPGAVFTLREDRLERMRLGRGALFPLDDEFPADVDCLPEPGTIVVITGDVGNPDTHWDVERSTYRAAGRRFERTGTERLRVPVGEKIGGAPFRSCPGP
jgi:hypothetical protein